MPTKSRIDPVGDSLLCYAARRPEEVGDAGKVCRHLVEALGLPVGEVSELVCFGWNDNGQCDVPPQLGAVIGVAAGLYHTAAIKASGELACFGQNNHGECDVPPQLGAVIGVAAGGVLSLVPPQLSAVLLASPWARSASGTKIRFSMRQKVEFQRLSPTCWAQAKNAE